MTLLADKGAPLSAQPTADADAPWVRAPSTVEETGIRRTILEELVLKTIARERELTTRTLGELLTLSPRVVDDLFQQLRKAQLVEVVGLTGTTYRATLTAQG